MPTRRSLLLTAAALAVLPVAAPAAEPSDPTAFMKALYGRILTPDGGGFIATDNDKARRRVFTKSLCDLWAKAEKTWPADEPGPLDFDVFTNSQDMPPKAADITPIQATDTDAKIKVVLKRDEDPVPAPAEAVLVFDLLEEGKGWRIDEIHGSVSGDSWTLRGILSQK